MMRRTLLLALSMLLPAMPALAADYRSVSDAAAVLYDAPSQKAKKLYLIRAQTPVELVVKLDRWIKVRDAEGSLAWIEASQLAERRTVIVTANTAELRQADQDSSVGLLQLAKWVVLDFVAQAAPGWVKVKHADGATGFVRSTQIWGL